MTFLTEPVSIYINKRRAWSNLVAGALVTAVVLTGYLVAVMTGAIVFYGDGGAAFSAVIAVAIPVIGIFGFVRPHLLRVLRQDPVVIITNEGVRVTEGLFAYIGVILWKDIVECRDIAAEGRMSPFTFFFVRDPSLYFERIRSGWRRRHLRKIAKRFDNSVLWVRPRDLAIDPTAFKRLVANMIAQGRDKGSPGGWGG